MAFRMLLPAPIQPGSDSSFARATALNKRGDTGS